MEKEIIQSMVASIPESPAADEIEKSMTWEETDGCAFARIKPGTIWLQNSFFWTQIHVVMNEKTIIFSIFCSVNPSVLTHAQKDRDPYKPPGLCSRLDQSPVEHKKGVLCDLPGINLISLLPVWEL